MIHALMHVDFIALTAASFLALSRLGGTPPHNSPAVKVGSNSKREDGAITPARQLFIGNE
jgi:hypothetical protein